MESRVEQVTQLLAAASAKDKSAVDELLPLVYQQLRAAAQRELSGERPSHTLQATALVHEAYLKLVGPREVPWANRAHFYAAAAEAMRRVLLDHAKRKGRVKRGGGVRHSELRESAVFQAENNDYELEPDFVALDEAIRRLEATDPRMAQVVHLKFYAGLEIAQVAKALGVSERTVKNDWAFAKAWLERALRESADLGPAERE
ncbi:MAG: ECF-type sigma factor [Phycisphaerales bacterium]